MRLPLTLLGLALTVILALPAQQATAQQTTRQQYIAMLSQVHLDPDMRQEMKSSGFKGAQLDVVMAHIQALFSDRDLSGYLADRMIEVDQGKRSRQEGLWDWLEPLTDRGLPHLSTQDMAIYLSTDLALLRSLNTGACARTVKGRDTYKAALRALTSMAPDALAQFYRISQAATKAGLRHARAPQLSEKAELAAWEDIMSELDEQIVGHRNYNQFRDALDNMSRAPNPIACATGRYMLQSVLNVQGTNRRAALQLFLIPGS